MHKIHDTLTPTRKRILAGGALSMLLLGGCANYDAPAATNEYAASHSVSPTCVSNLRAKLQNQVRSDVHYNTQGLMAVGLETCPTEDKNEVFQVASMVTDENNETNSKIALFGMGAVAIGALGAAGVAFKNRGNNNLYS